jgi:hypothetical protein
MSVVAPTGQKQRTTIVKFEMIISSLTALFGY